jgi:hypothetical protein
MVETIRPGKKKKRRAREFDKMMRDGMNNPIGETVRSDQTTVIEEADTREEKCWTGMR